MFAIPMDGRYDRNTLRSILEVSGKTVIYLSQQGETESFQVIHPKNHSSKTLVRVSALDKFLKKYITLGMMADNIGFQSLNVLAAFKNENIYPRDFPEHLSKIYLRDEVPEEFK